MKISIFKLFAVMNFIHQKYFYSISTNTVSFFSVLIAALIFSLCLVGVAAAQGNTSLGTGALSSNTTGIANTAIGLNADVSAGNLTNVRLSALTPS